MKLNQTNKNDEGFVKVNNGKLLFKQVEFNSEYDSLIDLYVYFHSDNNVENSLILTLDSFVTAMDNKNNKIIDFNLADGSNPAIEVQFPQDVRIKSVSTSGKEYDIQLVLGVE